jgi:colicin import membrane protein
MIKAMQWERSLVLIVCTVCGIHAGLILYLALQTTVAVPRSSRKMVHVQSVQLKAAAPAARAQASAPTTTSETTAAPKPAAKKKKVEPAAKAVVTAPVTTTTSKKPKIAADKIAQVKAALNKIQHSEVAVAPPKQVVASSGEQVAIAATYEEVLAERLRLLLTLPDYGDVKISLTLERSGKVAALTILKAASEENQHYVEKMLPQLALPPFGLAFAGEERHVFRLVLSN